MPANRFPHAEGDRKLRASKGMVSMSAPEQPAQAVIARALSAASRAPSVANSQPWLWRLTRGGLELFADRSRRLVISDPDARSLLISCGATLHHVQVAMAAEGWASDVVRMPDDRVPGLLASIQFTPRPPTEHDMALASAIPNRTSDRRPMSSWPVAPDHVLSLVSTAATHGAFLQPLDNPMDAAEWGRLSTEVSRQRGDDPGIQREIEQFARAGRTQEGSSEEGLKSEALSWSNATGESHDTDVTAAVPLLLATSSDDRLAELRAGEALSAVLLEATRLGLATRLDSQAIEARAAREKIEHDILHGTRSPQILVVVGWASPGGERPETARRPLESTLKVVDADSLTHQLGNR